MKRGICPACGDDRPLTTHHNLPRRIFGENEDITRLCGSCHQALEREITRMEKIILRKKEYLYRQIVKEFIRRTK